MGSPMRQPLDESGPDASLAVSSDASSGLAYTRDEVLRAQTITATSAARMIRPGIQMRLWLGCMAFSLRARGIDAARASHHSENVHAAIPCRFLALMRRDSAVAMRIVTVGFRYCWQLTRKLQMFSVLELFFALLAVLFFGAFPFEQLFFGHLVIVAGGEHRTALAALRRA
jgi:hypothetical protein